MSLRLFVAVEPSQAVRQEAARAGEHLRRALPRLHARYADPASLHLTLAFLGQQPEQAVDALVRGLRGIAGTTRPFTCATAGLGAFPAPPRPSVLWLGIGEGAGALAELQGNVAAAVAPQTAAGMRFVPHLTLARVSGLGGVQRTAVAGALEAFEPAFPRWTVDQLVLFRSDLSPQGARHSPLVRASLRSPA